MKRGSTCPTRGIIDEALHSALLVRGARDRDVEPHPARHDHEPDRRTDVKLMLAVGQHDADYVDAYYGPPEWKKAAESSKLDLNAIRGAGDRSRGGAGSRTGPAR